MRLKLFLLLAVLAGGWLALRTGPARVYLTPQGAAALAAALRGAWWSPAAFVAVYTCATALGIVPGTLVYTYFADAMLQGSRDATRGAFLRVAVAGGLLVLLSFAPALARRAGWLRPTALPPDRPTVRP